MDYTQLQLDIPTSSVFVCLPCKIAYSSVRDACPQCGKQGIEAEWTEKQFIITEVHCEQDGSV